VQDYNNYNWSLEELAQNYTISLAAVLAALLYYQEHEVEILQQDQESQEQFDILANKYGQD
jgi:uncharacterized protein (DUF433 family)